MLGEFDLPDQYAGYEKKSPADYYRIAGEILSGAGGGGVSGVAAPSGEVYGITVK